MNTKSPAQGLLTAEQFNNAVLPKTARLHLINGKHELDPEHPELSQIKKVSDESIVLNDKSKDTNVTFTFAKPCMFVARTAEDGEKEYFQAEAFKAYPARDGSTNLRIHVLNESTLNYEIANPATDRFIFTSPKEGALGGAFMDTYHAPETKLIEEDGEYYLENDGHLISVQTEDFSFSELFTSEPLPQYDDEAPEQHAPEA